MTTHLPTPSACRTRPRPRLALSALPALLCVLLAVCAATPAGAQAPFSFRVGRGELGVMGQGSLQQTGGRTGGDETYGQWLRLPVAGYLIHPRVLAYSVTLSPQFNQHQVSHLEEDTRTRNMGSDLTLIFFPARRVSLSVQSIRSGGRSRGAFAAESEFRARSLTAALFLRDRYFPTTLTYQRRSFLDAWSSAFTTGDPRLRDESESRLRLEIRNRKLLSTFTRSSKQDRRGRDDFVSRSAQFSHALGWGKGSSLQTALSFFDREGFAAIRQRSWSERAHIQHTSSVASNFFFSTRSWGRGEGASSTSRALGGVFQYRPSPGLSASLLADYQSLSVDTNGGGMTRYALTPTVSYQTVLPAGVRLTSRLSAGMENVSLDGLSTRFLDVLDEPHPVDESLRISLDQVRVDPASIDVWSEDRTIRLERDVDYRVLDAGGFVEIQILPGSRLPEGSGVLISYRYEVDADERAERLYYNYEGTLTWKNLSLRHGRRERTEDVMGDAGIMPGADNLDIWYGAGVSGRTPLGPVRLEVGRRERTSSGIRYLADEVEAQVDLPFRGAVRMGMQGSVSRVRSEVGNTLTRSLGGHFAWTLSRTLRLRGSLRGFTWDREGMVPEAFLSGNAVLTWSWGQINTLLSYDQSRRWNGDQRTGHRWSLRVVRRF